jgi:hypothetical protein
VSVVAAELHSSSALGMTAADHSERHWQLVARRQRLRQLNAPRSVLGRNRALIAANLHAWNVALVDEHLGTRREPAAQPFVAARMAVTRVSEVSTHDRAFTSDPDGRRSDDIRTTHGP